MARAAVRCATATGAAATFRDKAIYLHILKWSGDRLHLPPLRAKVVSVGALTGGSPTLEQTGAGVTIVLPPDRQDKSDTVVKLELDAPAAGEFIGRPALGGSRASRAAARRTAGTIRSSSGESPTKGLVRVAGRVPSGTDKLEVQHSAATGSPSSSRRTTAVFARS